MRPEALAVKLGPYAITDLTSSSVSATLNNVEELMGLDKTENSKRLLSNKQQKIGELVLKEIRLRLQFLLDVGLDYLCLLYTSPSPRD